MRDRNRTNVGGYCRIDSFMPRVGSSALTGVRDRNRTNVGGYCRIDIGPRKILNHIV
jgi:hypothetical protein